MNTTIASCREQIQEDLLCLLESANNLGLKDYLEEVQTLACQIVVKNFKQLEKSLDSKTKTL
jgi:hypothetical protein